MPSHRPVIPYPHRRPNKQSTDHHPQTNPPIQATQSPPSSSRRELLREPRPSDTARITLTLPSSAPPPDQEKKNERAKRHTSPSRPIPILIGKEPQYDTWQLPGYLLVHPLVPLVTPLEAHCQYI